MANPNDKKDYIRTSLGHATAQICQGLGWHSVQRSSHDVLTDVLERYLCLISKRAALVSQTCCRTAPNLDDVVLAFNQLGIHIHELQDYMLQVEPSPALKCIPKAPVEQKTNRLLDFSGEDFLPPLIDVSVKEEEEEEEIEVKEEPEDSSTDPKDESSIGERPKTITFRTDSVESPPYSPLEPKSLNLNALQNTDLTRPDLKVTTPKGYVPTLTTRPVVATISSLVNSTVKSPAERKRTPTPTQSKSQNKAETKTTKKEKKESKKTQSPQSLLSPPSSAKSKSASPKLSKKTKSASPSPAALAAKEKEREQKEKEKKEKEQREKEKRETAKREKEQRDREKREQKEREKQEKEREKQEREREKQEKEREKCEKEREKQEREREKQERQKQKDLEIKRERGRQEEEERLAQLEREREHSDPFDEDPPSSPEPTYLLHAPRAASPSSTLFSPPRVRIASYQSEKKKPLSKDKDRKEKKDSNKEDKKSKHKKKSSAVSSPASSIGSLKSPPSARSDLLSPPKLSQPIIKHEKSSNKTVMFPPDSSPDISVSPARNSFTSPDEQQKSFSVKQEIKQEEDDSPLKINPISSFSSSSSSSKHIKKESKNTTDASENEIDVTSFSQGEETAPSYSESFQPNMFFPTKLKDEKKKKKKKKSEKDRDEKMKKKEDKEKKKERKRKLEESPILSSTSTSTTIPKLTLKMGSEKIRDNPPPAKIPKKRAESPPPLSLKTVLVPSASHVIKKKKDKKKDKHKEKSRDFEDDDSVSNSGFYVESQTDTAHSYDNKIYYCPGCGKPDDGSPMIGCDKCDDWYHWPCVHIVEEPAEDEKWFCPNCPGGFPKKKKKKKKRDDD